MTTHPMHGRNRFKLGVFAANADGGLTLTRVPERWPADWAGIVEVAQLADRAGIEFFLPIARWKGCGGEMNSREWSFETFTFAAGGGTYPLVGTLRHIADEMMRMAEAEFAGTTVSFVNFKNELPYFLETVLPLLREAKLRQ